MQSLIDKLYKELVAQQKYLKREDIRNAKKSNQTILRLVALLEEKAKPPKINVQVNIEKKSKKGV
tara:strand:+ start:447 stop:641 length:195 start_codon:yes stop_codon:yes gene_type:complete